MNNTPKPIIIIGPRNSGKSRTANSIAGFKNKVSLHGKTLFSNPFAFNSVSPKTDLIIIDDIQSPHDIFDISMSQTNFKKGLFITNQGQQSFYHKCQIVMVCHESIEKLSPGVTTRCDVIDLFKNPIVDKGPGILEFASYSNSFSTKNQGELNLILLGLLKLKKEYKDGYNATQRTICPQAPEKELVDCLSRYRSQMDSASILINKVNTHLENASRIQSIAS